MKRIVSYLKKSSLLFKISIWLVINTVLGTIISFFISLGVTIPFFKIFISCQIITHTISGFCLITGYSLAAWRGYYLTLKNIFIFSISLLAASIVGAAISMFIPGNHFGYFGSAVLFRHPERFLYTLLIPAMFITIVLAAGTAAIELLQRKRNELEKSLADAKNQITEREEIDSAPGFSFKEKGVHYIVKYSEIIYCTSQGKTTVIHTTERDYQIPQLLKDIDIKLPRDIFLRIHRRHIVNIHYIERLQYYEGGRHIVHLKDDDETILPIGKDMTKLLKKQLGV